MIFSVLSPRHLWHVVALCLCYWKLLDYNYSVSRNCQNLSELTDFDPTVWVFPRLLFHDPVFFSPEHHLFSDSNCWAWAELGAGPGPVAGIRVADSAGGSAAGCSCHFFWFNCLTFDWILSKTERGRRHRFTPEFPRPCRGRMKSHRESARQPGGLEQSLSSHTAAGLTWGWTWLWRDEGPASRPRLRGEDPRRDCGEATADWSSCRALERWISDWCVTHGVTCYLELRGCSPGLRTWRSSRWRWRRSSRCCRCCRRGSPRCGGDRTRSATWDNDQGWPVTGASVLILPVTHMTHMTQCWGVQCAGYGTVLTGSWLTPCQSSYLVSGAGW